MKEETTIKDNKWVWPISDENSWEAQSQYSNLHEVVVPRVSNRRVMIQAGGNCGYILSTFVPYFDCIYTFEPDPINFYCLNQNVTDKKVIKLQACLSEHSEALNTQQLVRPDKPHDTGGVHVSGVGHIPGISIDNLTLQYCDLIQLDVEGYELRALKGAINTIKKHKPVLCIELCEKWLNRYENTIQDVLNFVDSIDYMLIDKHGVDNIFIPKKTI